MHFDWSQIIAALILVLGPIIGNWLVARRTQKAIAGVHDLVNSVAEETKRLSADVALAKGREEGRIQGRDEERANPTQKA